MDAVTKTFEGTTRQQIEALILNAATEMTQTAINGVTVVAWKAGSRTTYGRRNPIFRAKVDGQDVGHGFTKRKNDLINEMMDLLDPKRIKANAERQAIAVARAIEYKKEQEAETERLRDLVAASARHARGGYQALLNEMSVQQRYTEQEVYDHFRSAVYGLVFKGLDR